MNDRTDNEIEAGGAKGLAVEGAVTDLADRARRRLFERLVRLSAARELTGRPTLRFYGL